MTIRFYKDKQKQWRWRAVSRNGRIVAEGGEGYRRAVDAKRALFSFLNVGTPPGVHVAIEGYPVRGAA